MEETPQRNASCNQDEQLAFRPLHLPTHHFPNGHLREAINSSPTRNKLRTQMQLLRSACTQLLLLEQLTLKVSTTPIYPEYFRPHQSPTQPRKFTPPKDSGTTISSRQRQPTFSKMRHWRAQSVDTSSSFLQKCQQSAMSPRSTRRKRPSK